jgi:competence protein ComEA
MRNRALIVLALVAASGLCGAVNAGPAPAVAKPALPAVKLVDINHASRAQLKTLPGIGAADAERIVAGRPYLSKADLATKSVIPTGVYLSLKHRIIATQKARPKGKH